MSVQQVLRSSCWGGKKRSRVSTLRRCVQAKEEHPDATEEAGPWLFTLDFPSYMPIMTHATNRHVLSVNFVAFRMLCSCWCNVGRSNRC